MVENKKNKNQFVEMEEEVLKFWDKSEIFKQSVEKLAPQGDYVFYDGPPFATGTPHYGHLVGSVMKDVVPKFWTMRGYRVERRWGWDCHGLPIENIVEKELGTKSKKQIEEEVGIEKFNETCRSKVLSYADDWKKIINRLGRFVDMDNAYKTMDLDYMESIWAVFKNLWDKDLIYKDYRSMHVCPRCETTLSQSEVTEGYKDIKDLSVTAKFELVDEPGTFVLAWTTTPWTLPGNVALAVGNDIDYVKAIIIEAEFNKVGYKKQFVILSKEILENNGIKKGKGEYIFENTFRLKIVKEFKGSDLVGKSYKPVFDYLKGLVSSGFTVRVLKKQNSNKSIEPQFAYSIDSYTDEEAGKLDEEISKGGDEIEKLKKNAYKIYSADFVTTENGTGVVHIAPAFGEDDMTLGRAEELPFVQHVSMDGIISKDLDFEFNALIKRKKEEDGNSYDFKNYNNDKLKVKFAGLNVKPKDNIQATDIEIIKYLSCKGLLFSKKSYPHSYPHCWRCETPLLNYATSSWFVNVKRLKGETEEKLEKGQKTLLENAKEINWVPEHIKPGRFGKWLEGARDWSISRQRFWASVMPIWECPSCGELKVLGSVKELEDLSGEKVTDLHKHVVDKLSFACPKCPGKMKRIPDVLDCWFESGSMPYAQLHYPFENKEKIDERTNYPAQFIAEGADQTRAWFYYLHVIAGGTQNSHTFDNVIVNGIVLAEDGKKMSKRLQNYPDPMYLFDKYGADALRYYLSVSSVMTAENLNFSEQGVLEVSRKLNNILWNVYKFYEMYSDSLVKSEKLGVKSDSNNILDKWIITRLNQLIAETTKGMEEYNIPKASRPIIEFVDDLSTWYLRRSRDRIKGSDEADKKLALETLRHVFVELAKVMAIFTPFIAETLYQKVTGYNFEDKNKSVHLEEWPTTSVISDRDRESSDLNIPVSDKIKISEGVNVLKDMEEVRKIVELGLAKRDEVGIKIKQPLSQLQITNYELRKEYIDLVKDELNVKEVVSKTGKGDVFVELDTKMTPELLAEGSKREVVRFVNAMRKNNDLTIEDRVDIFYKTESAELKKAIEQYRDDIAKDTLANGIKEGRSEINKEVEINNNKITLSIKKL